LKPVAAAMAPLTTNRGPAVLLMSDDMRDIRLCDLTLEMSGGCRRA
jgi:hypothetical protein